MFNADGFAQVCELKERSRKSLRWVALPPAAMILLSSLSIGMAHPLDPLSADEITTAVEVLRAAGLADAGTRFPLIDLDEPPKAAVLASQPGQAVPRSAFVVARQNRTVYEGEVDLGTRSVTRWQAIPNVQSSILTEEWERAQQITTADPGWRAAMQRRGYTSFDDMFCAPLTVGYFTDPAEEGRRLLKVLCYDTAGGHINVWGRPIEGLYAVVDLDAGKVIRLVDEGVIPVSRDTADFVGTKVAAVAPPAKDREFAIEGNSVHWRNWSFHFRMDRRAGPIVSLVRYQDGQRLRMVLYRGSLAEMFVPYMDPDSAWSFRTYMDVGEYGFGLLSSPLAPGIDCPADAAFIDAVLPDDTGAPMVAKSRICVFERDTDDPLWRHTEFSNRSYAGHPATELVLRSIASVGNYDYVIDWVLTEAGVIRIDVGSTGIVQVKGVTARSMADQSAPRDTAYGTLVAPNLTAINHDHFLSFRLDVDIDGESNTLVRQLLSPQCISDDGQRRSLWRAVNENVTEEGPLEGESHGDPEIWRVVNPNSTNALDQHPGYELRPGHSLMSMLAANDFPQRRAGFTAAPLWVTAYDPRELYAAGPYPNQSKGGEGLPSYVARHRAIENADIVLWYTMGFHHVPRPEDWPVMPTLWHSVSLVPNGFFDRNPALGETAK